jgi:hypothetical protein
MLSSYRHGPRVPSACKGLGPRFPTYPVPMTYFKAGDSHRSEDVTVYLDGVPVPLAVEASVVEGYVMTYEPDGEELKVDFLGRTVVVKLRGRVEIRRA